MGNCKKGLDVFDKAGYVLQSKTVLNIILTLCLFLASVQHMQCTVT